MRAHEYYRPTILPRHQLCLSSQSSTTRMAEDLTQSEMLSLPNRATHNLNDRMRAAQQEDF